MHTVTWIERYTHQLHSISTPNAETAFSLHNRLSQSGIKARLWHSVKKGQPQLIA